MTSAARSAIFASIRENLAASRRFDSAHEHRVESINPIATTAAESNILDRFIENVELVGARSAIVQAESEASARLGQIVAALSATKVVVSDSDLVTRLTRSAGLNVIEDPSRDDLFESELGVTGAQWAIAETGTLVLESAAERNRLVSLVPPVHVCILRASTIRESMTEILEEVDPETSPAVTFITGASRTSDIELTLAIGVHGPGELHVIVIKEL